LKNRRFPTARDTGSGFPLAVTTVAGTVAGRTVPEFLINILWLIDKNERLGKLEIPFPTSGANYLLACSPEHKTGRPFSAFLRYESGRSKATIYVNTNHPRFFGLRQGVRLLDAAGLAPRYLQGESAEEV